MKGTLIKECHELHKGGALLLDHLVRSSELDEIVLFSIEYQAWYSLAARLVGRVLPERLPEFKSYYLDEKRKKLQVSNYGIHDFLRRLSVKGYEGRNWKGRAVQCFMTQLNIVQSIETVLESTLSNIDGVLAASLSDSELEAAGELVDKDHIRASGALGGVVLERHLARVAGSHNLKTRKKPTIAVWNDLLKAEKVIDVATWRRIQAAADVRNTCVHATDVEPKKDDVEEFLQIVGKLVKTVH